MKTTLRTDITVKELCEGFVYNELEGKGLFGLSSALTTFCMSNDSSQVSGGLPQMLCKTHNRAKGNR